VALICIYISRSNDSFAFDYHLVLPAVFNANFVKFCGDCATAVSLSLCSRLCFTIYVTYLGQYKTIIGYLQFCNLRYYIYVFCEVKL
jgi:hypothetical protein